MCANKFPLARLHKLSLTPPARELPCRQYNSSVPRLPLQAFLSSVGCCGSHCVRQFWKNIIAVLRLDGPRTMACCRQGSPQCCLRCRFRFQRQITICNGILRELYRVQLVISKKTGTVKITDKSHSVFYSPATAQHKWLYWTTAISFIQKNNRG